MIKLVEHGVYSLMGHSVFEIDENGSISKIAGDKEIELPCAPSKINRDDAKKNTMAYSILKNHNISDDPCNLKIRFDSLVSHDITYVSIIQSVRAGGLKEFPLPYTLTNCHNSLCAVGGTINEDDHVFGLSAAKKYGGIYVPTHLAVIHQYAREMMACCGNMILGSDSHTRYGALGTMGIGEGGPELVKQLFQKTYDIPYPEIIAVFLEGKPKPGVGPQDVALAIIGAVFKNGFVKNKVLEFIGPGIENLSVDFRNGIDVMTTETACLSSIWTTDEKVREYFELHGRSDCFTEMRPRDIAYYDGMVKVNLDKVEPMIALPFHPSNVYTISELNRNCYDILSTVEKEIKNQFDPDIFNFKLTDKIINGRLKADQGIVAGCAGGTFENIFEIASMADKMSVGSDHFSLSVYPASQPIMYELVQNGAAAKLLSSGIVLKTAFCGPCFGAGDIPAHGSLSIRHTTRNFMNREGSKPADKQVSLVALMDARSIAATALNGGLLTPATEMAYKVPPVKYTFNKEIYKNRVYNGYNRPNPQEKLKLGPNITDWPKINPLPENLLLEIVTVINDPVTTTDELIPSGETSSLRSNPIKLAEYTLSRKDPSYVSKAKKVQLLEKERQTIVADSNRNASVSDNLKNLYDKLNNYCNTGFHSIDDIVKTTGIGSCIYAVKPGDGSAREQAASCQKILGGWANIATEYATKRYRSNLINWGILPFTVDNPSDARFNVGDWVFIPGIRKMIENGDELIQVYIFGADGVKHLCLLLENLSKQERDIILKGCLINYYAETV